MTHIPDGLREVIMEHLNEYIEREIQVMNRFSDSVLKEYFKIASNVRWVNNNKYATFDIALFKQGILYAIVEVKTSLNKNKERAKIQIQQALELTNCRFGIITDNDTFYFYDRRSKEKDFKDIDFESLVQHLLEPESISDTDNDANSIDTKEKINITLNKYLDEKIFISIQDDIAYDKNQGF